MNHASLKTVIVVPCYDEEGTVAKVIEDFQKALPEAEIHIFDNNSQDNTAAEALKAGAIVHRVKLVGKGNVVRRMFADVDADTYIMVDGDATYDAASAPALINKLVDENLDMVVGCRVEATTDNGNYRPGHRLGNKLLTASVQAMFDGEFTDMLSGYRAFSRRFVKSFPAESAGFETETELTVHALSMKMPYGEVSTPYYERPEGSESKLSTYKDGTRILNTIIKLYSTEKPLQFWAILGGLFIVIAVALMVPIILEFLQSREVLRFPTVIVASGLGGIGVLCTTIGVVLRTVTKGRDEAKHLAYLRIPPAANERDPQ